MWGDKSKAEPQSGLEMGLRLAMKMAGVNSEEVFGQVKAFAENGTLQKIVDFADHVELNNFLLGLVYNAIRQSSPELPELDAAISAFKSRSSSAAGGPGEHGANRLALVGGNDTRVS
jgi:hypothetical protein